MRGLSPSQPCRLLAHWPTACDGYSGALCSSLFIQTALDSRVKCLATLVVGPLNDCSKNRHHFNRYFQLLGHQKLDTG
jgi:hypothetical protein